MLFDNMHFLLGDGDKASFPIAFLYQVLKYHFENIDSARSLAKSLKRRNIKINMITAFEILDEILPKLAMSYEAIVINLDEASKWKTAALREALVDIVTMLTCKNRRV